jgi:protein-disulfide isomerase
MEQNKQGSVLNIPTAIVIAGAIIAGSIIWTSKNQPTPIGGNPIAGLEANAVKAVTANDHILGNPNALIKIVEYSDTSCPFCKMFHSSMRKIINEYGRSGKVAWVYRHFPIDKQGTRPDGSALHPNAGNEAHASECVASLGGNEKFWNFINKVYEVTPSVTNDTPNGLDQKQLPIIAKSVGIDVDDFNNCMVSGKFKEKIESQYNDGLNLGIEGTPTSFIISKGKQSIKVEGAQSYDSLKQALDAIIKEDSSKGILGL